MAVVQAPPPLGTRLIQLPPPKPGADPDDLTGYVTREWNQYFLSQSGRLDKTTPLLVTTLLDAQAAAILSTPFPVGVLAAGLYRVAYAARITTPGTVSSSLTVSIGFTDRAVACVLSGAALTGNTANTVQSGIFLLRVDQNAPITYAAAYASVGATVMQFSLALALEKVG